MDASRRGGPQLLDRGEPPRFGMGEPAVGEAARSRAGRLSLRHSGLGQSRGMLLGRRTGIVVLVCAVLVGGGLYLGRLAALSVV